MAKKRDRVVLDLAVERENVVFRVTIEPGDPVTVCEVRYQAYPIIDEPRYWGEAIAYGMGVRKEDDWYDREIGCRMALKSALKKIKNKDLRRGIWEKFLEVFPVDRRTERIGEAFVEAAATSIAALYPDFGAFMREVLDGRDFED